MAGQGHQFPGGFPGGQPPMRNNFAGGPMGTPMTPQMGGMMNGQMTPGGMVGMGNQMGQPYGNNMQNAMGGMGVMPNQGMSVGSAAASPNQGVMGMSTSMGSSPNMSGSMSGSSIGSPLVNPGMNSNMGITSSPISASAMAHSASMQPQINPNTMNTNTNVPVNQSPTSVSSQSNQAAAGQPQQNKDTFNVASLCRFGQETVQDMVSRTLEVFQTLKAIQPPNGTTQGMNSSNDKKAKIQEQLRTIRLLFKRLRLIYEKCSENCQVPGMEYTHIESLIPLKDEYEHKSVDEKKTSETYKQLLEENRELTEQVVLKNKQLKEVINNLRTIIWEINVMLSMRRS